MKINGLQVVGVDVKVIENLEVTRHFALLENGSKTEITSNEYSCIMKILNNIPSDLRDCVFNGACGNEYIRN